MASDGSDGSDSGGIVGWRRWIGQFHDGEFELGPPILTDEQTAVGCRLRVPMRRVGCVLIVFVVDEFEE